MLKLNKTLIQKDRGGFQNGPWNGHFESEDGLRRYFTIQLHFHKNGTADGYGQDQLGKFKLKDASFDRTQAPHTFKGRLRWDSKLEMDIAGVLDPTTSAINGTFSSNSGDGSLSMQPTFTGINELVAAKEPPTSPRTAEGPASNSSGSVERPAAPQGPRQAAAASRRAPGGPSGPHIAPPSEADLESIASLMEMGFDKMLCELAVHNAGTREAQVDWIYNNMDRVMEQRQAARPRPNAFHEPVPAQLVQQLVAMGFEAETATVALRHHNMDVSAAAEYLLTASPPSSAGPNHAAGGTDGDLFGNLLATPAPRAAHAAAAPAPPAHLVAQLLEIVPAADRRLAAAALLQNDNDLERAINWVLEGGTATAPAARGMDDLFGHDGGGGDGAGLAVRRRRAPAAHEEDLFAGPAPAATAPAASGGFDDFFAERPSASTAKPAAFDPFASEPTRPAVGSATQPHKPGRAAPAPPKRAPPAPPGAAGGGRDAGPARPQNPLNPLAGLPSLAGSHSAKHLPFNAFSAFPSDHSAPADPFPPPAASSFPAASSDPFSSQPADPFGAAADPFPAGAPAPRKPSVSLFEAHGDPFASPAKDPFPPADPFPSDPFPVSDPFPAPAPAPAPTHPAPPPPAFAGSADPFASGGGADLFPGSSADPFAAAPSPAPPGPAGFFSHPPTQPRGHVAVPKPKAAQDPLDDFLL